MNGVTYIITLEVLMINYLEKIQIAKQRKYRILRNYSKPRGEYIIFFSNKVNKLSLHMISIFIFNFSNYVCRKRESILTSQK